MKDGYYLIQTPEGNKVAYWCKIGWAMPHVIQKVLRPATPDEVWSEEEFVN